MLCYLAHVDRGRWIVRQYRQWTATHVLLCLSRQSCYASPRPRRLPMTELLGGALGTLVAVTLLFLALLWPLLLVWLMYRFTHDLRRIASALERMEVRRVQAIEPTPLPIADAPLQILADRPVANSMFGR